jgi:class 3 adenylate cyclase
MPQVRKDVTGLAVTIAARITDLAPAGTTWVSSIVKGLVVGSGIDFESVGSNVLKGVPEEWALYRVSA